MNLFELFATIGLDSSEYEKGLETAEKNASSAGSKIGAAISNIAKVSTAAIGAAATGVTAITTSAVKSYADYEQLVGGIETLFGDAAGAVIADADAAFKTAGVSVNEYMETSIQSAAALINSLGGNQERAAKMMNMSITDMADNVNKMGTNMEAVQNAYRGFSRGNFTMLDNLALGFAGTKEGMQELIDKANEIRQSKDLDLRDLTINSYADIVQAIHEVQDEMGITGTTAREAASTISGSANAMKSAWKNLLTGFGDSNADIENLVTVLIDSVETMMGNLAPVVSRVLSGIAQAITKAAPRLAGSLVGMFDSVVPELLTTAASLLGSLADAIVENSDMLIQTGFDLVLKLIEGILGSGEKLSETVGLLIESVLTWIGEYSGVLIEGVVNIMVMLAQVLIDNYPIFIENMMLVISYIAEALSNPETITAILTAILSIIETVGLTLIENIPVLTEIVMQVLDSIVTFITENLPLFIESALQIMITLAEGLLAALPQVLEKVPVIINTLTETLLSMLPVIVKTGVTLLTALITNLPQIINTIVDALPSIIDSIVNTVVSLVPEIVNAGVTLLTALVNNLPTIISTIVSKLPQIITSIVSGLAKMIPQIVQAGVTLLTSLVKNLPTIIATIVRQLPQIITAIVNGIIGAVPDLMNAGSQLITGLWQGISNVGEWLREKISGFFGGVVQSIKNFFGIKSPSKVFAGIGEMLDRGLAKGVGDYAGLAVDAAEEMAEDVFGATDRDFNFTATGKGAGMTGRNITINVYGAEGQDVNELAEIISQKIAFGYTQEQAVWA